MNERLHVIITGENGRSSSFQICRKKLLVSAVLVGICLIGVCAFGYFTTGSYFANKLLTRKVNNLEEQLAASEKASYDYVEQISTLKNRHDEIVASLQQEHSLQLADQQMKFDLENTNLQLENMRLMTTAVSDLNERSELIESVMNSIGIKLKGKKKTRENSGGPFIPASDSNYSSLLKKVDDYLQTIRIMPLGRPIKGQISSGFGNREDPLNEQKAFHEGVDIRGNKGEKVHATADGVVAKAFNNGGYGNYVEIDHGNGYHTVFAHLQSFLVKPGERVKQGQIIGQVGNTGRSTGPHLHYEILLNGKPINPSTFLKVAELAPSLSAAKE